MRDGTAVDQAAQSLFSLIEIYFLAGNRREPSAKEGALWDL
jgi:hypothetical protein